MTPADRKTLSDLIEYLDERNENPDGPIPQFLATLGRVLEEPGDAELLVFAFSRDWLRRKFDFHTASTYWEFGADRDASVQIPRHDLNEIDGPDDPPVLTPSSRAVLLEAWRKGKAA